jgi:PRTRC genetic system protein C
MALNILNTTRVFEFQFKGEDLKVEDPNPSFSPDEVVSFLSNTYPTLTNSTITGPEIKEGKAVYNIKSVFGEKG